MAKLSEKELSNVLIEFKSRDGNVSQVFVDNATGVSTLVNDPETGEVVEFLFSVITTKVRVSAEWSGLENQCCSAIVLHPSSLTPSHPRRLPPSG